MTPGLDRWARGFVITAAAAFVAFGVLAAVVVGHRAPFGPDRLMARHVTAAKGTTAFEVAWVVSFFGLGAVLGVIGVAIAVAVYRRTHSIGLSALVPATSALAGLAELAGKQIVRRDRPATAVLTHTSGFAFPSGHTTAATAFVVACVGVLVVLGYRRRWPVGAAVVVAVSVGISRVVLGAHWLTDVIGGLLLGIAVGAATVRTLAPRRAHDRVVSPGLDV